MDSTMRPHLAELFGTFVLVFVGTGAMVIDQVTNGFVTHVGVALTFGLAVMALIYALGEVSGAHLNPAGLWVYLMSPALGAVLAVVVCRCVQRPGCCASVVDLP